jgi:hypothetical protein
MDYPRDFPPEARARVEAEGLKATRDLERDRDQVPWSRYGPTAKDEENLRRYILRVFLAFAQQACKLGPLWTVDRIRAEANEFLRRFTIEAYYHEGHDKDGRKLRDMVSHVNGSILPEVRREFEKSELWHQFQEELLAVAEAAAGPETTHVPAPRTEFLDSHSPGRNARLTIIHQSLKQKPRMSAEDLCKRLDCENHPPLEEWREEYNVTSWTEAYREPKLRPSIQAMLSKDKREIKRLTDLQPKG